MSSSPISTSTSASTGSDQDLTSHQSRASLTSATTGDTSDASIVTVEPSLPVRPPFATPPRLPNSARARHSYPLASTRASVPRPDTAEKQTSPGRLPMSSQESPESAAPSPPDSSRSSKPSYPTTAASPPPPPPHAASRRHTFHASPKASQPSGHRQSAPPPRHPNQGPFSPQSPTFRQPMQQPNNSHPNHHQPHPLYPPSNLWAFGPYGPLLQSLNPYGLWGDYQRYYPPLDRSNPAPHPTLLRATTDLSASTNNGITPQLGSPPPPLHGPSLWWPGMALPGPSGSVSQPTSPTDPEAPFRQVPFHVYSCVHQQAVEACQKYSAVRAELDEMATRLARVQELAAASTTAAITGKAEAGNLEQLRQQLKSCQADRSTMEQELKISQVNNGQLQKVVDYLTQELQDETALVRANRDQWRTERQTLDERTRDLEQNLEQAIARTTQLTTERDDALRAIQAKDQEIATLRTHMARNLSLSPSAGNNLLWQYSSYGSKSREESVVGTGMRQWDSSFHTTSLFVAPTAASASPTNPQSGKIHGSSDGSGPTRPGLSLVEPSVAQYQDAISELRAENDRYAKQYRHEHSTRRKLEQRLKSLVSTRGGESSITDGKRGKKLSMVPDDNLWQQYQRVCTDHRQLKAQFAHLEPKAECYDRAVAVSTRWHSLLQKSIAQAVLTLRSQIYQMLANSANSNINYISADTSVVPLRPTANSPDSAKSLELPSSRSPRLLEQSSSPLPDDDVVTNAKPLLPRSPSLPDTLHQTWHAIEDDLENIQQAALALCNVYRLDQSLDDLNQLMNRLMQTNPALQPVWGQRLAQTLRQIDRQCDGTTATHPTKRSS
ncbi:hypothetical protein H4R34_001029 [Dimargaris verticillata]|uniref:Uncharacterized protein n=1 Tax=Dimargaris verticillata TaxID=2761393 RepID=A0A9W8EE61_9FUNG|nr:hypothetical protein H4R34_001029 [Dimargaris verticillata]